MKIVLDAWAILAYLQGEEPAATRVSEVLKEAEVFCRVGRDPP